MSQTYRIPATVFANYQGYVSQYQEIKLLLAKWVFSPILFDFNETSYLETNVTEITFTDTSSTPIPIQNLTDNMQTKEPYTKMSSYSDSNLKCKSWKVTENKFTSEGCDSFAANSTELMCLT